ncbi:MULTISPECIES: fibronectin type III domain-containing protein [unclassified Nocardioides]|uniref:fibronectin type III domain-containing protein n=1 Tax=unclassified Nocardioides TaxID=2615069 RepID=UPI0007036E31|nr:MULTISPECIES: hypothetical protein [unclassified Nocardioides]KRC51383.1 hypothetical protein ASE19_14915 [Nocardioides sp. Root79]KRC68992.1 hypothetical protein ASE20_15570 [Nocardioides sp. Root240]
MRTRAGLISLALLGSSLAAVAGATVVASPASALAERWCVDVPAPCVESLTVNGTPVFSGATVEAAPTSESGRQELHPAVDVSALAATDVIVLKVRTPLSFNPERATGRYGLIDVDRGTGTSSNWFQVAGTPVLWANGCVAGVDWPWFCPETADSNDMVFDIDLADLDDPDESSIGQYAGTNATYNGIFFEEQADGSHALTTEVVAPHFYFGTTTPVVGSVRFRVSHRQMRLDMGIPNPETLVPGSLSGTINGGTGGGSFTTWQDPDGAGFFIEASGFTFSLKKLKVRAARITPTRPTITRTKRLTARAAVLTHTASKARGARVTSYAAVCRNRAGHVVRGTGLATRATVVVTGLRRGKAYTCQVVANSKAGRSLWSPKVGVRARP